MLDEATKKFVREHRFDNVQKLALQSQSFAGSGADIPAALTQISGRQLIEHKIPSWYASDDMVYPVRLPLEQCSSEATARYKSSLLSGRSFLDLTGGFGVDTAFISTRFLQAVSVEKQKELAAIARHNFAVLKLPQIQVCNADGIEYLKETLPVDCVYLDPARRSGCGKKVMRIEDCEPDITQIQDLLLEKAGTVLIKLSPMLDIPAALKALKKVREVHVVSVENECKELLFLCRKTEEEEPVIHCVNLRKKGNHHLSFTLSEEKETTVTCCREIKEYLYEPDASLLKAGFYKGIARRYALEKLHPDSHLYTASRFIPEFPGRVFQVETVSSMNKKDLKELLKNTPQAHLSVRNFPLSVAGLRQKWKLKEGGGIYLFATTLAGGKHVVIKTQPAQTEEFI